MAIKDLGAVTAYAYAVQHGYTGTEAEFEEFMALLPQRVNDAQDKIDEIAAFNVEVSTGAAGSQASASYNHSNSKLSLTIPRGDTGEISQEFVDENLAYNDGYYEEMSVGGADQIITDIQADDDKIYTFRTTGGSLDVGDRKTEELVGGTVAWNQLIPLNKIKETYTHSTGITVTNNGNGTVTLSGSATSAGAVPLTASFTLTGGHKVYVPSNGGIIVYDGYSQHGFKANGNILTDVVDGATILYAYITANSTVNNVTIPIMAFDLTQMFGSTIADAIYAMEQTEAGSGVAWFKKYFPKSYYAYNAGSLQSVNVAAGINTGFNQWDEEWENGYYDRSNGNKAGNSNTTYFRSKNFIPCLPSTTYHFKTPAVHSSSSMYFAVLWYDADKNYISDITDISSRPTRTAPSNAHYMTFYVEVGTSGATYQHDICINISWDGSRDGEYEPYDTHVYNYDSDLQLRGIPSLDEFGNLVYDGDVYEPDGTVTRKYGIVDMGTLTWGGSAPNFYATAPAYYWSSHTNFICQKYEFQGHSSASPWYGTNKSIKYHYNGLPTPTYEIYIRDEDYNSIASFKTAMSGVYLIYELATPTEETADPFTSPQIINDFGTEEWIDAGMTAATPTRDVLIPPGHNSAYMVNLKAKLEMAPNSPDGDGEYLVRQRNGENEYVPFSWTGDHLDLTAGSAHQLISTVQTNDQTPYLFRTSGGSVDIGDREYINGIVGGSVAWNQSIQEINATNCYAENGTTATFNNGIAIFTASINGNGIGFKTVSVPVPTHKYLVRATIKASEDCSCTLLYGSTGGSSHTVALTTEYLVKEVIIQATSTASGNRFYIASTAASVNKEISVKDVNVFDLTQMFGSADIADYIYALEQNTARAGVAKLKQWGFFTKPYYAYDAGSMKHASGLVSHDMTGFNQWDEEWEVGGYNSDGTKSGNVDRIRCKNFIHVLPSTSYYIKAPNSIYMKWYDANKTYIGNTPNDARNVVITSPTNACYMRFFVDPSYGTTYNHDICINISWDGSRDGEYEPYVKHSYPLDSDLTLRGIPKLDANNNLYYDGDVYEPDGTVTRKYGIVDLGTLGYTYVNVAGSERFYTSGINNLIKVPSSNAVAVNVVCQKYNAVPMNVYNGTPKCISCYTDGDLLIRDTSIGSASELKTSLNGVYLVYELATSTTETADPYTSPQIVDDFGTEEFVTTSIVPVGHDTDYPINLVAKVEMAPNSPDGDGDYVVQQTNGTNEYVALGSTATIQNILSRLEALEGNE